MAYGTFNFLGGRLMIPNTGRTPELPREREGLRLVSSSSQNSPDGPPECSSLCGGAESGRQEKR